VQKFGIGYALDVGNTDEVINFIKNLTKDNIEEKIINCQIIPKEYCINDNSSFFVKLKNKMEK
jgi:hypothetical protein